MKQWINNVKKKRHKVWIKINITKGLEQVIGSNNYRDDIILDTDGVNIDNETNIKLFHDQRIN